MPKTALITGVTGQDGAYLSEYLLPEYDLAGLITDMMQSDVKIVKKEVYLKKGGFYTPNYFE